MHSILCTVQAPSIFAQILHELILVGRTLKDSLLIKTACLTGLQYVSLYLYTQYRCVTFLNSVSYLFPISGETCTAAPTSHCI